MSPDAPLADLPPGAPRLELLVDPQVSLAGVLSGVPLVQRLILHAGDGPLHDVTVQITVDPPFAPPWATAAPAVHPGGSHPLGPVDLAANPALLRGRAQAEPGLLRVRAEADGELIASADVPLTLLPAEVWPGLGSPPELLAAFVLLQHPAVGAAVEGAAAAASPGRAPGGPLLDGPAARDPGRVRAAAAAVAGAFAAARAGAPQLPAPPACDTDGQALLSPASVLGGAPATPLDLAITLGALLEAAGLSPLLGVADGAAFAGAWLTEAGFGEPAVDDPALLRKRLRLGELWLVDAAALGAGAGIAAAEAVAAALLDDSDRFRACVDLRAARREGVRPLPPAGRPPPVPAAHAPLPTPGRLPPPRAPGQPPPVPPAGPPAAPPPLPPDPTAARIQRWKDRLLDLSLRNRLLNLRPGPGVLAMPGLDIAALEDALAGGSGFTLKPRPPRPNASASARTDVPSPAPEGGQAPPAPAAAPADGPADGPTDGPDAVGLRRDEQAAGVLRVDLTDAELATRGLELYRQARSSIDESGAVTLYLALGGLRWFESPSSEEAREAPLLLIPVTLERLSAGAGFRLSRADDETRVNMTLLKKLELDFGLQAAHLAQVAEDAAGVDVPALLRGVADLVRNQPRWDVTEGAWLARFSFTKLLMWLDLEARSEELLASPVVRHLFAGKGEALPMAEPVVPVEQIDQNRPATKIFSVIESDPSQLQAVLAAADGSSFVLQGPPGTGKSQTITQLIAQVAARGETVLFVSEKRAALDVVARRLGRIGLGPFCLELHSQAAAKRGVMDQLTVALDAAGPRGATGWEDRAAELQRARERLNAFAALLRQPTPYAGAGLADTTFGVLEGLIGHRAAPDVDLPPGPPPEAAALKQGLAALEELRLAARGLSGAPAAHPLAAARCAAWDPAFERAAAAELDALHEAVRLAAQAGAAVASALQAPVPADRAQLQRLDAVAAALLASPAPPMALLAGRLADHRARVDGWLAQVGARQARWTALSPRWSAELPALPALDALAQRFESWAGAFFLFAWIFLFTARGPLRRLAAGGRLPADPEVRDDLRSAQALRAEDAALVALSAEATALLGRRWTGADTRPDEVRALLAAVEGWSAARGALLGAGAPDGLRARLDRLYTDDHDATQPGQPIGDLLLSLRATTELLQARAQAVADRLRLPPDALEGELPGLAARVQAWRGAVGELRAWCRFEAAAAGAEAAGMAPFVAGLRGGGLPAEQLLPAARRAVLQRSWEELNRAHVELRGFDGEAHEALIARARQLDAEVQRLGRAEVFARLAARAPRADAPGSELAVLRRELQKKSRHRPLRRLFSEIPETLRRLKPVVLMSPLSVAQYLDPSLPPFDLVVFDEASQIPPWDAVGAIARGARTVIVGDSRQLPPTTFFSRGEDSAELPDEEDVVELESVLEEAVAAGVPELRLRWHYRSRHEALIAFSNHHYYEGKLHTFPCASPNVPELGVHLVEVPEGVYERGGDRCNRAEAEALVAELVRILKAPTRRSVGVVTFSMPQQRLIEDLVDKARAAHPEMEAAFGAGIDEPVFVKNLENVQGDERDVMLFSVCYAPDRAGKITMNFGPLNRSGGERRLNVAVTRARELLMVFSTLKPEHIDLRRTRAVGAAHLRTFLDYARRGMLAIDAAARLDPGAEPGSPFEVEVLRGLRARGWDVDCQVGVSGYRIDLGVRHPDHPGAYLAGVECDGAAYHSSANARERDLLRQTVLEGLGWTLHRVWSTDWWMDRDGQLERLQAKLEADLARARAGAPPVAAPPAAPPAPEPVAPRPAPPPLPPLARPTFRAPALPAGPKDAFAEPQSRGLLLAQIRLLADAGPITRDHAVLLIREAWGFRQAGARIRARIEALLDEAGHPGELLWPPAADREALPPLRAADPADPASERAPDHLPVPELASGALEALDEAKVLTIDELSRVVAARAGLRRGAALQERLQRAVELLAARGLAAVDGDRARRLDRG